MMLVKELEDSRTPKLFYKAGRRSGHALKAVEHASIHGGIASRCCKEAPDIPQLVTMPSGEVHHQGRRVQSQRSDSPSGGANVTRTRPHLQRRQHPAMQRLASQGSSQRVRTMNPSAFSSYYSYLQPEVEAFHLPLHLSTDVP